VTISLFLKNGAAGGGIFMSGGEVQKVHEFSRTHEP
jgi:hypothetical protein